MGGGAAFAQDEYALVDALHTLLQRAPLRFARSVVTGLDGEMALLEQNTKVAIPLTMNVNQAIAENLLSELHGIGLVSLFELWKSVILHRDVCFPSVLDG